MNGPSLVLPSFSEIEAALSKTTEMLAAELVAPSTGPPAWTEFEWRVARSVASMHGISSLLYSKLLWEGPTGWREFLHQQQLHSIARHQSIVKLIEAIDLRAQSQNLRLVALKGSALYAEGIYAAGERPMSDIDLLVSENQLIAAGNMLKHCGYEEAYVHRRHAVYLPKNASARRQIILSEHVANPIKIELHTRIAEQLPITDVDITKFLIPPAMKPGLNYYPSRSALLTHLLLHAAGNMRAHALRMIQLHDISLLATLFRPTDWAEFLDRHANNKELWWAAAPIILTSQYYPDAIPHEVIDCLASNSPALLARSFRRHRLTSVSWSNLRIDAFPGLEWSRTLPEAFRFMLSRIWPSRAARLELREGAATIPNCSLIPWYGLSHGSRILRWVFSKPPRVQTLLSVHAALTTEF